MSRVHSTVIKTANTHKCNDILWSLNKCTKNNKTIIPTKDEQIAKLRTRCVSNMESNRLVDNGGVVCYYAYFKFYSFIFRRKCWNYIKIYEENFNRKTV